MEVDTSSLQKLLQEKEQALIELKTSYEEYKNDAVEYEKELEADNEHKEKEIDTLQKKLETALKKMEDYKKEINQSGKIMEREKARLETLNEEVNMLKNKIVYLEQLNEGFESEIRNVKFEKQSIVEKLEGMEERFIIEKEDLEEQLNQKNQELERFRLDVHEYEDEIVTLRRRSSFKQERNSIGGTQQAESEDNENEKLTHLQEEISKYREEIENAHLQLGDKDREIKGCETEIKRMQNEIQELNDKLEEKEKQLTEVHEQFQQSQTQQLVLQERVNEQDKNLEELSQKLKERSQFSPISQDKVAYSTESPHENEEEMSDQRFKSPGFKTHDLNVLTSPIEADSENYQGYTEDDQQVNVRLENIIAELSPGIDERSKSVENLVLKLQEENQMMMEKYTQLLDLSTLLQEKVTIIQQEKNRLEKEVYDKDSKILCLEEHYIELQEELEKLRRGQQSEVESDEKELLSPSRKSGVPKLDIPLITQGDLDTMSSDRNQSTSKTPKFNVKNMDTRHFNKHLYIKPSIHMTPPYLTMTEERDELGEKKQTIKIHRGNASASQSYSVDNIYKSLQSINAQEIMNQPLESMLGKNLLFLIYGEKGTDKKQVKYKILTDILNAYRTLLTASEFREKILKFVLKIQDPVIFEKIHRVTTNPDYERLEKPIEVRVGDVKSEQRFNEYLRDLRAVDNLKTMNSLSHEDCEQSVKQMVLELVVENMEEEGKVKIYDDHEPIGVHKADIFAKTKIVFLTVDSNIEEANSEMNVLTSKIDQILSMQEKQKNLMKFLILTINPSSSEESYKAVSDTLAILGRLEKSSMNVSEKISEVKGKENESMKANEKAVLPNILKDRKIIHDYVTQMQSLNDSARFSANNISGYVSQSMAAQTSFTDKKKKKSNKFLGFFSKWKSSKNFNEDDEDFSLKQSGVVDPSMSMMSSKSLMEPTYNIKKSVV
jgi:peptidoglycan hydrolase CwlO-like protein